MHTDAEVGVFAALADDHEAMRSFIDSVLGPLALGTPNRRLELVATLEALLDSRSIGEASERLGVHRHTVVYRIGRLRQLGIDADDPGAASSTLAGVSMRPAARRTAPPIRT